MKEFAAFPTPGGDVSAGALHAPSLGDLAVMPPRSSSIFDPRPQTATEHAPSESAPKTIYVVDSEPAIASSVAHLLQFAGFTVSTFSDRVLAWFAITTMCPKPALLITDYLGGSMTGLELIARCKAEAPALKILLCSGLPQKALPPSTLQPDEFLEKPFSAESLVSQVCRLLGDP